MAALQGYLLNHFAHFAITYQCYFHILLFFVCKFR